MSNRDVLLLLRRSPYDGVYLAEAIDAALVAAAFDMTVTLLFTDVAVFALLDGQQGGLIGRRTMGKVMLALPDYEINQVCVCSESLASRNLAHTTLILPVTLLDRTAQAELISRHSVVWND